MTLEPLGVRMFVAGCERESGRAPPAHELEIQLQWTPHGIGRVLQRVFAGRFIRLVACAKDKTLFLDLILTALPLPYHAGLIGHGVLGLVEAVKSTLAAEGAQVLPATATLYCIGIELVTVRSWQGVGESEVQLLAGQHQQGGSSSVGQQEWEWQPHGGAASGGQARGAKVNLQVLQAYRYVNCPKGNGGGRLNGVTMKGFSL